MRHAGAVRNEELLDFASLCCEGKSFLIGGRKGDTACDLSPVVSFSCNQSFGPSEVVSGYFFLCCLSEEGACFNLFPFVC